MHENFKALDAKKRDRIINAAMGEFSAKGYNNASTNEIVKKAEISKGALFHYFSSKRNLLEFLCGYGIDLIVSTLEPCIGNMPTDVFERLKALAVMKIKITAQYPDMSSFLQNTFTDDTGFVRGLLREEYNRISGGFLEKLYDGIDFSKFRTDVDVKKALKIIWWVLEGFAVSHKREPVDFYRLDESAFVRDVMVEMDEYLGMLRRMFYRAEYIA